MFEDASRLKRTNQGFTLIQKSSGKQQGNKFPSQVYHGKHDQLKLHRVVTDVYQDMNQPFSRYWISSSYNTYITKKKRFSGVAGVDVIKECLLSGCRSIELDCREPKRKFDKDIRVDNGWKFGKSVDFSSCLQTIKENAFKTSKYPVILVLESHIKNMDWLDHMATMLERILTTSLYTPPQGENAINQPPITPHQLRQKIVIKMQASAEVLVSKLGKYIGMRETLQLFSDDATLVDYIAEGQKDVSVSVSESKMMSWLRNKNETDTEICISTIHQSMRQNFLNSNVLRVFPSKTFFGWNEFNPWVMWICGVHQACLNWQSHNDAVFDSLAFFRDNGACGYVLQPSWIKVQNASRFFRNIEIHCFGLITATYKGEVEIKIRVCGTEQQFKQMWDDDCFDDVEVAEFRMQKCGHTNPNLDFNYKALRCSVQEDVGTVVVCVTMGSERTYAVLAVNNLRDGAYIHQLLSDRGRVSTIPSQNDCIAIDIKSPTSRQNIRA